MKAILSSTIVLAASIINVQAHAQKQEHPVEIGVNAGTYIYQGDLTPSTFGSFRTPGIAIGLVATREIRPGLATRLDISAGNLRANEGLYRNPEWRRQRGFGFNSPVGEVVISIQYYPAGKEKNWSPYILGGAGIALLQVMRTYTAFNPEFFASEPYVAAGLAKDLLRPTPRALLVLPVGAGVRHPLNDRFALTLESTYRIAFSDYIDGFSKAANPTLKDHYFKHAIGLVYSFARNNKTFAYGCPAML